MSSENVASNAFAVRRRRVSRTAIGRWLPSFHLKVAERSMPDFAPWHAHLRGFPGRPGHAASKG